MNKPQSGDTNMTRGTPNPCRGGATSQMLLAAAVGMLAIGQLLTACTITKTDYTVECEDEQRTLLKWTLFHKRICESRENEGVKPVPTLPTP